MSWPHKNPPNGLHRKSLQNRHISISGAQSWILSFYVLLCIVGQNYGCDEENLPNSVKKLCLCANQTTLDCRHLNSTRIFQIPTSTANDLSNFHSNVNPFKSVHNLKITDSEIKCLNYHDLKRFSSLISLSVTSSGLKNLFCQQPPTKTNIFGGQLKHLNLARNKLTELKSVDFKSLKYLQELNASQNAIQRISSRLFVHMKKLKVLDLSDNKLDENLQPSVLESLPKHMSYLDISSKYPQ